MPKLNCWERSQVQNMYDYMQTAEDVSVKIGKLYGKAFGYISALLHEIYEKHQTKYKLTNDEAIQLLSIMQDRTSISELMEKIRESSAKDENRKAVLSQLESVAYKSRLESLQQLQNQIDYVMANVYQQEKDFNTSHYVDLANEAYYKGIYDMQQMTKAAFSFTYVDEKTIDRVIQSKWSGKNYSDRIWDNTKFLAQDVKEELLINLVTGRTNNEVADIITNKYHIAAFKARRLIRTESNYVATEMKMKAYEDVGVEEYRYLASLELHTSEICRNMDGKIFPVSQRKPGVNCPPLHPWCRSTTISVIGEDLLEKLHRSARDPKTGQLVNESLGMNYVQWHDKYVKGKTKV
jgi:SPP1 gp7 family putative phage head morphogenesis protein